MRAVTVVRHAVGVTEEFKALMPMLFALVIGRLMDEVTQESP